MASDSEIPLMSDMGSRTYCQASPNASDPLCAETYAGRPVAQSLLRETESAPTTWVGGLWRER